MRSFARPHLPRAVVVIAAACATPTQPAGGVQVRVGGGHDVSATFDRVDGAAAVPYVVVNTGPAAALLTNRCGDHLIPAIEQRRGSAWASYAAGACLAIYPTSPVPLAAGADRVDAIGIRDPGEYRLVLDTTRGSATSVAFTVR